MNPFFPRRNYFSVHCDVVVPGPRKFSVTLLFFAILAALALGPSSTSATPPYPPLTVLHGTLLTTAGSEFEGHDATFAAAVNWHSENNLRKSSDSNDRAAPYFACAAASWSSSTTAPTGDTQAGAPGHRTLSRLQSMLNSPWSSGKDKVRAVSNSEEHGVCFLATATLAEANGIAMKSSEDGLLLASWVPFPSVLKLAPGLLDHNDNGEGTHEGRRESDSSSEEDHHDSTKLNSRSKSNNSQRRRRRLTTTHGERIVAGEVHGLEVELAPGLLPARPRGGNDVGGAPSSDGLADEWSEGLMHESLDLHGLGFWSDEAMRNGADDHLVRPGGAVRAREWTGAADVVHELSGSDGPTPGEVCSWDGLVVYHTDDGLLTLKGIDHLFPGGKGAGGSEGDESDELRVACFMGLLSFLTSRPEVLRISAAHEVKLLNAAAFPNIQSATLVDTPLTDSGLDGSGEVIQVVDTGLDYNSCFFVDEDGQEVTHGHYFEELGVKADRLSSWYSSTGNARIAQVFTGGDFNADLGRRKIVQYIDLVKQDPVNATTAHPYGESWMTTFGQAFPWISPDVFEEDAAVGHGTHTAGSAAGATISSPATTEACSVDEGRETSCVGGCIVADDPDGQDDLLTSFDYNYLLGVTPVDLDRLCPRYECDGQDEVYCLGDDAGVTLAQHGGMARGAKLAIFDIIDDYGGLGVYATGNGIWEPAASEAGSRIHSNSWGVSASCLIQPFDVLFDDWMYKNPENLLVFAAGNDGDSTELCTIGSPAASKNVLTVGASTSGPGRLTFTGTNGEVIDGSNGRAQDIDMMAYFSSYGPMLDNRIKPEVVAPGDMVYSAAGGGTGNYTCRLWQYPGTSMACPITAGAAALVRQYFTNETFYANDVDARGLCDSFGCEAFSPSAATVKAMLINSANLMNGTAEPNGIRGFGRVHLAPGMPLLGEGTTALFVADSSDTSTPELTLTEYSFGVDGSAGLELRATLSWIDPPTSALSLVQLIHDLDLAVYSPAGTRYSMWANGEVDSVNNNERVIVPAADVEKDPGTWVVRVWAKRLAASNAQSYSLVVTGAIGPAADDLDGEIAERVATTSLSSSAAQLVDYATSVNDAATDATSGGVRSARVLWLSSSSYSASGVIAAVGCIVLVGLVAGGGGLVR